MESVFGDDPTLDPQESTGEPVTAGEPVTVEPINPGAEQPATQGQPASTEDLLQQILDEQRAQRAELQQQRTEIDQAKQRAGTAVSAPPVTTVPTREELEQARADDISRHDYYCPGCGRLVDYQQQCSGRPEAPHPPIEVVSTDELKQDDPSKHTHPEYANESDRVLLG